MTLKTRAIVSVSSAILAILLTLCGLFFTIHNDWRVAGMFWCAVASVQSITVALRPLT